MLANKEDLFFPRSTRLAVSLLLYLSVLVLVLMDRYADQLRPIMIICGLGLLAILDLPGKGGRPDWRAVKDRLLTCGAIALFSIGLGEVLRLLTSHEVPDHGELFSALFTEEGLYVWLLVLWLASPWVNQFRCWTRLKEKPAISTMGKVFNLHIAAWLLFLCWCFIASYVSVDPETSMNQLGEEFGLFAGLFLYWIRHWNELKEMRRVYKPVAVAALGTAVFSAAVIASLFFLSNPSQWDFFTATGEGWRPLVQVETLPDGSPIARLTAPMHHHNRAAFFSALTIFLLCLGACGAKRKSVVSLLLFLAALSFVNLLLTLNRGALLATAIALFVAALLALRSKGLLLIPIFLVGVWFLPQRQFERVASIFDADTYEVADSTVVTRFQLFEVHGQMILDNPLMGLGYGWETTVKKHAEYALKLGHVDTLEEGRERGDHAHNVWIQTGAETGIPGFLLFALLSITRWVLLGMALRRADGKGDFRTQVILWIAVEILIQVYAMSNLPTRRSLGIMTAVVWAIMLDVCRNAEHQFYVTKKNLSDEEEPISSEA